LVEEGYFPGSPGSEGYLPPFGGRVVAKSDVLSLLYSDAHRSERVAERIPSCCVPVLGT
jgi:hypothetical protein